MSVKPNGCTIVLSLLAFTVELILLKSKKKKRLLQKKQPLLF